MPAYSNLNNDSSIALSIHPIDELKALASSWEINDIFTENFSIEIDKKNTFPYFRDLFYIPILKDLPESENFIKKFF